jgi:exopolysaccharide biosynthesis polyprenyl glycosylphosphotransferase
MTMTTTGQTPIAAAIDPPLDLAIDLGIGPGLGPTIDKAVETADAAAEALRAAWARPRPPRRGLGTVVLTLDALAAAVGAGVVGLVQPDLRLSAVAALAAAWPAAIAVAGGYSRLGTEPRALRPRALLAASAGIATLAWLMVALVPLVSDGRTPSTLAASTLLLAGTLGAGSLGARVLLAAIAVPAPVPTVLVGSAPEVRELIREAGAAPGRRPAFAPVAVCLPEPWDDLDPTAEAWPVPVWHDAQAQLVDVVRSHGARAVVVVPGNGIGHAELRRWGAWLEADDVDLLVSPGLRDVATSRLGTTTMGGSRLLRVAPVPRRGPARLAKELVDRLAALLLLVALSPILAVAVLLIRRDSPGAAIYRQTRVGLGGRPFTVYKLRTMCAEADVLRHELTADNESDHAGVLFKIKRDPRITGLGAKLRATSLDELPQLVNVVRGEMSLIGPRPALPREVQAYSADLRHRLTVKPGLTGLWQVSGRSDLSWEETVRLDLQYVDNWSWSLDLSIAARTFGAVLGRRGAY